VVRGFQLAVGAGDRVAGRRVGAPGQPCAVNGPVWVITDGGRIPSSGSTKTKRINTMLGMLHGEAEGRPNPDESAKLMDREVLSIIRVLRRQCLLINIQTGPQAIMERRTHYELPPLVLHPFDHRPDPDEWADLPCSEPLTKRYLETRYNELRMLCLIGKDLNRWLSQCVEVAADDPELADLSERTFITVLLFDPPRPVLEKMHSWGVKNFQLIFSRAIGLNTVFPHPPSPSAVSESLLRRFDKYADALYDAIASTEDVAAAQEHTFTFELFASGEYASRLERAWEEVAPEALS
jgi:hypothetical protein